MKFTFKQTIYACFMGYIVQAIVNNFAPLLFLTFQSTYNISLDKIALLVTFNFGVQLLTDAIAPFVLKRIGYRIGIVIAHVLSALGLILMGLLPNTASAPYVGLLIAVTVYAIGGGLLEVLVSPIVEACPTDNKEAMMSLLHSFYCWGHVGVVLASTLFFLVFNIQNWPILAFMWALIPIFNAFIFTQVPIVSLEESTGAETPLKTLIKNKIFWMMIILMICAGACEQSVSQWASAFVEKGLGVNKMIGDLAGPMTFAILMGLSRVFYSKYSIKINLETTMLYSGALCFISYLLISLSPNPFIALVGCAICGFSVGILWPGTFSLASKTVIGGGTTMFALLALAGDLGCAWGPTFVGYTSEIFNQNLKMGILSAIVFPMLLILGLVLNRVLMKKKQLSFK